MDNVVQNISMEDIIPSNFQPTNEEERKIEELAQLMKSFGMIDPIIVRTKNGKYEIVLGMEKYQAAKLAGLTTVPAIIKEIDDEAFSKYLNVEKKQLVQEEQMPPQYHQSTERNDNLTIPLEKQQTSVDNLPTPEWQRKGFNTNPDIVNLAELSKINLEYERDDLKMNNGQMNNMMNNNLGQPQPTQGPTFGGRFFPSLEDEPTNMNMMGSVGPQAPTMASPTPSPEMPNPNMNNNTVNNNNLIDLTDLSIDKEPVISPAPDFTQQPMSQQAPEINQPMRDIQIPQTDFSMNEPVMPPQPEMMNIASQPEVPGMAQSMMSEPVPVPDFTTPQPASQMDNIISLENLQNNNPAVQPIAEPVPTPMATLNEDFGAPTPVQPPQFDMSQNIAPQMTSAPEVSMPMNDFQMPQANFGMNGPTMPPQPEIPNITSQPEVPGIAPSMMSEPVPAPMATLNEDFGSPSFSSNQVPTMEPIKDIAPVTNTIKNLVTSLEAFGYKININEEELPTSIKLIIEVEK